MKQPILLRPHNIGIFFRGNARGYDNMMRKRDIFLHEKVRIDPEYPIKVVSYNDSLCDACPKNVHGRYYGSTYILPDDDAGCGNESEPGEMNIEDKRAAIQFDIKSLVDGDAVPASELRKITENVKLRNTLRATWFYYGNKK